MKIPAVRQKLNRVRAHMARPWAKVAVAVFLVVCTILLGVFAFYYHRYEQIVDRRMRGQVFNNSSKIYARPRAVRPGDRLEIGELANYLRRAGYTEAGEKGESPLGTYRQVKGAVEIRPGPQSYHSTEGARVEIRAGKVERLLALSNQEELAAYELEPQLVTALFDPEQRMKRRLLTYDEIPSMLVNAVTAIEDQRFFTHSGVNFLRLMEAAYIDLKEGHKSQGGSTITMQIARGFFLTPQKTIKRKLTEMLIAFQLEQRFSKKQIFELYANQVYMGQRGSFAIRGFAEAARSYFNKDVQFLNLPEAALLAGIIQRPNSLDPFRYPERALARRNLVLEAMVDTGAITREQAEMAKATPLQLASPNVEASDAPYFVDLVRETLVQRYSEEELDEAAYRVYTTLDPDLQQAAANAVQEGLKEIDELVRKQRTRRAKVGTGKSAHWEEQVRPGPQPQVALVVLDPHTGEVLALVGGRNYSRSQLNHAVAMRPTGSVFKPFVYATAMNTAVAGGEAGQENVFTPASMVDDSPTTFVFEDKVYEPRNYKDEYHGPVTTRYALAHSLNNATVRLAEQVGFGNVVGLARAAGIKSAQPTPSVALGAYEATPLEVAGAYTVFANGGVRMAPLLVKSVRDASGDVLQNVPHTQAEVLDPRVAAVMTNMLEAVVNSGTGFTVRARGFTAPAAGKTGTSHDGWFAGYTSNLLTVAWVGYDDYTDLKLSGSQTAAVIWTEFMKKAVTLPQYRDVEEFEEPEGVVDVQLDRQTNRLATPRCPEVYTAAFIAGTEPHQTCDDNPRGLFDRLLGLGAEPLPPAQPAAQRQPQRVVVHEPAPGKKPEAIAPAPGQERQAASAPEPEEKKKKGFFGKIFGIFKGDSEEQPPETPPPPPRQRPQQPAPAPER